MKYIYWARTGTTMSGWRTASAPAMSTSPSTSARRSNTAVVPVKRVGITPDTANDIVQANFRTESSLADRADQCLTKIRVRWQGMIVTQRRTSPTGKTYLLVRGSFGYSLQTRWANHHMVMGIDAVVEPDLQNSWVLAKTRQIMLKNACKNWGKIV